MNVTFTLLVEMYQKHNLAFWTNFIFPSTKYRPALLLSKLYSRNKINRLAFLQSTLNS